MTLHPGDHVSFEPGGEVGTVILPETIISGMVHVRFPSDPHLVEVHPSWLHKVEPATPEQP